MCLPAASLPGEAHRWLGKRCGGAAGAETRVGVGVGVAQDRMGASVCVCLCVSA